MKFCVFGLILLSAVHAWANPEPEIPVTVTTDATGTASIVIEIDPRCFTEDPMRERYFMNVDVQRQPADFLEATKRQALEGIANWLIFSSGGNTEPLKLKFEPTFSGIDNSPLKKADDPAVVRCLWTGKMSQLQIQSAKQCRYSVIVRHPTSKTEVTLFPGEKSAVLRLSSAPK